MIVPGSVSRQARLGALYCLAGGLSLVSNLVEAASTPKQPSYDGITATQLAVVINTADPVSVAIGTYFVQRRQIPRANVARVSFAYHRAALSADEFATLKAAIDAQLPHSIQAYALTWVQPYRVGCMSVTAAFTFGFDRRFCSSGCQATQLSPYFDSSSGRPFDDLHIRPSMSIAAVSAADGKSLIDRGVQSDGSHPQGTAYLLVTGDSARDVRASEYADSLLVAGTRVRAVVVHAPYLEQRKDVMFYFIGAVRVPALETNQFLPGAVADHLTSFGGALIGTGGQMSSLHWLEAGATGSYGTVVEPCNITSKFPNTALLLEHYLAGETLLEAYWKSVAMPGQGVFIGEPLAAPFRLSDPAATRRGH